MLSIFGRIVRLAQPIVCTLRYRHIAIVLALAAVTPLAVKALDPSVPPGTNFNLSYWQLQLPIGSTGNPTTISNSELENGYENYSYFFTESGDGAMVMKDPGVNCVTTPNSKHCRTELREVDPSTGNASSWSPNAATNRLKATLAVMAAGGETVIGQIHIDDSISTKPVCELYYHDNGDIYIGVEQTRSGGDEILTYLGNVPEGTKFSYEIEYYNNLLKVAINGSFTTLNTYSLDAPNSYFKAGTYGQNAEASDVHFFSLTIQH